MRPAAPAAALLALAMLAACSSANGSEPEASASDLLGGTPELAEFYGQELAWEDCGDGFQCATFEVPMDYEAPDGDRVEIAVNRLPAAEPSERIGSLVLNPGGPGGSGIEYAAAARLVTSAGLQQRFDIVGFDPRGVGQSTPLSCMSADEMDEVFFESDGGDEMAELEADSRAFAEACEANAGPLLGHVGTDDVARDLDVLRALLGDEQLSYMGASYGTYIGAYYAELFPDRARALVLDGAVDPQLDALEVAIEQAEGFETAFDAYAATCVVKDDCPLGTGVTVEEARANLTELVESVEGEDLENNKAGGEPIDSEVVLEGVLAALYSPDSWTQLNQGLTDVAEEGNGTRMQALVDALYEREDEEAYTNSTSMLYAVNCLDYPTPRETDAFEEAAEEAEEAAPLFGADVVWGSLPCAYWPVEGPAEPPVLTGAGAAPILVVGTTRDSATPYVWAEALAEQLESGVLLTRDGDGHTGYMMGDSCIDQVVDTYLIDLEVPSESTVCWGG
ncbi:alpha/beta hydrolase [Allonocardiopsis opalescens]|uniref:Tripeptidyl-peptidase B n=1 Tax=Allonocardiopsis opalescens TaxID=1144618 RepID=A0A2T0Q266_9ACTN|nr:alpha/beta hydrolase [Allonocardiopsis opalescens]PRX97871.1 tripeptidyl-peptidase B [Allonocardiopsis opalescens]